MSFMGARPLNPGARSFSTGARPFNLKALGDKLHSVVKDSGRGGDRPDLKQYWKDRSKEIHKFKLGETKESTLEKANFFLDREEEMMRAVYRKRRR
jgi:hypothetical protein